MARKAGDTKTDIPAGLFCQLRKFESLYYENENKKMLTRKQISKFIESRYPEYKHKGTGIYCGDKVRSFISDQEIIDEAAAEKKCFEDGIAEKPEWMN